MTKLTQYKKDVMDKYYNHFVYVISTIIKINNIKLIYKYIKVFNKKYNKNINIKLDKFKSNSILIIINIKKNSNDFSLEHIITCIVEKKEKYKYNLKFDGCLLKKSNNNNFKISEIYNQKKQVKEINI